MKKVLMILLILLALPFTFSRVFALETVTYTPTYYDDYRYDFVTGAFVADTNYIVTNRMLISSTNLTLTGSTAHHIFFWDKNNTYLGYGNVSTTYEAPGAPFLGNGFTGTFAVPSGAKKFALEADTLGYDRIAVDGNTYAEVFLNPSYLDYDDAVIGAPLDTLFDTPLYLDFETEYAIAGNTLDEIFTDAYSYISNMAYTRAVLSTHAEHFGFGNVTVMSLTNLITNGGMLVDTTPADGLADGFTLLYGSNPSIFNGTQRIYGDGFEYRIRIVTGNIPVVANVYYYLTTIFTNNADDGYIYRYVNYQTGQITDTNNGFNSFVSIPYGYTGATTYGVGIYHPSTTAHPIPVTTFITIDNFMMFDLTTSQLYTKTQLDTALSYFGYLTYNEAYVLPDQTDYDFNFWGDGAAHYIVRGQQIGTNTDLIEYGLYFDTEFGDYNFAAGVTDPGTRWGMFDRWRDIYGDPTDACHSDETCVNDPMGAQSYGIDASALNATVLADFTTDTAARDYYVNLYYEAVASDPDHWEWYSDLGITSGNYAYYTDLYDDAVAQTERYEWYTTFGVTSGNYAALRATFDFYDTYYDDGYTPGEFDNIVITYTRDELVPVVVEPVDDWLASWIEDTLGLAEFGDFPFYLLAAFLIVGVCIIFALLHASMPIVMLVGSLTLILTIVFGWLPIWLGFLVLLIPIGIILIPYLFGGGGDK